jgi:hypothetical protein
MTDLSRPDDQESHFESHAVPTETPRVSRSLSLSQVCLLVLIGFLAGCLTLAATKHFGGHDKTPKVYVMVQIPRNRSVLTGGTGVARDDNFDDFRRMQTALVKSQYVLQSALNKLPSMSSGKAKEQTYSVAWLGENLQVDLLGPEIMRIGIDRGTPEEAAELIEAVVNAYVELANHREQQDQIDRLQQLKRLQELLRNSLDQKVHNLPEKQDFEPLMLQRESVRQDLLAYKQELRQVRLARIARITVGEEAQLSLAITGTAAIGILASPMGQGLYLAVPMFARGEIGARTKADASTLQVLDAQEKALREAELKLTDQLAEMEPRGKRGDLTAIKAEIEVSEQMFKQVTAEVTAMEIEINGRSASNRIRKLGEVVVRDGD